jgi:hypothetical protein
MGNNFCSECGTQLKTSDQKFCSMCGTPTSSPSQKTLNSLPSSANQGLSAFAPLYREFNRQEFPDFAEGVFSFRHANLTIVEAQSCEWFPGAYRTASELTSNIQADNRPEWISEFKVNDWFLDGDEFFAEYEPIAWEESTFGQRFFKVLRERGAVVAQGSIGMKVEFQNPNGSTEVMPLSKQIDLVSGQWGLSDGTPYAQKGEVFRSRKTGKDIVFWNFDALATTRPRTNKSKSDFTEKFLVPHLLQVATYLAETPFPSSLFSIGGMAQRETSFGDSQGNKVRPVIRHQKDARVLGIVKEAGMTQSLACWAPDLWQHGYVFDESMSEHEIYEQLPTVCDGIPKIADILVDGYCNWLPGSELDFQISFWSDYGLCTENDYFRSGAIVPGILYWELMKRSMDRYDEVYFVLKRAMDEKNLEQINECMDALLVIAQEGVGSIFLHAGNTWASQGLEIYEDFICDQIMEYFSTIDVDSQGINALSNLIVSYIKEESFDKADGLLAIAIKGTERMAPNFETHSYFQATDGSVEIPIFTEIFESALTVKEKMGKRPELIEIAKKAIEFCEKYAPNSELLTTAKSFR